MKKSFFLMMLISTFAAMPAHARKSKVKLGEAKRVCLEKEPGIQAEALKACIKKLQAGNATAGKKAH